MAFQLAARVDADLAARTETRYQYALITIGSNDLDETWTEAEWKGWLAYILDAIHAKWPDIKVGVAWPWIRNYNASAVTYAGWIASVVAARPWAFNGPNESVYLENGDNGTTYTTDGVHPTTAGYDLAAALWVAALPK
jgi:lysophospholipase L1-like esterase